MVNVCVFVEHLTLKHEKYFLFHIHLTKDYQYYQSKKSILPRLPVDILSQRSRKAYYVHKPSQTPPPPPSLPTPKLRSLPGA